MKHIIRPIFKNYLCIICASFSLIACSYFDRAAPDENSAWVSEPAPVVKSAPAPVNIADVIARATQGRVQLFGLEYFPPAAAQGGGFDAALADTMEKEGGATSGESAVDPSMSATPDFPAP